MLRITGGKEVETRQRVVVDRLCMAIALIVLHTTQTCWPNSITDIVNFGSVNSSQCLLTLILLKNIVQVFENEAFDVREKRAMTMFIRENLPSFLDFSSKILQTRQLDSGQQLPNNCYLECLGASKQWLAYSSSTFVPSETFAA